MTSFLIKKDYGFETGPYQTPDGKEQVVALDLVNYIWSRRQRLPTAVADPFVVYRKLVFSTEHHDRQMMRLSEFKKNYVKL